MGWIIGVLCGVVSAVVALGGVEKLVRPHAMSGLLQRGLRLERVPSASARAIGALEIGLVAAVLSAQAMSAHRVVGSLIMIGYVLVATPLGVVLLLRTGDCGCGGALMTVKRVASQPIAVGALLLRNTMMCSLWAFYAVVDSSSWAGWSALAVALGWLVQSGLTVSRSVREIVDIDSLEALPDRIEGRSLSYQVVQTAVPN